MLYNGEKSICTRLGYLRVYRVSSVQTLSTHKTVNNNYHFTVQPDMKRSQLASIELLDGVSNVDGKRRVSASVKEMCGNVAGKRRVSVSVKEMCVNVAGKRWVSASVKETGIFCA